MSNVTIDGVSMEPRLQDMVYETLFEIFRRLPNDKLIEISRLCSKLRDIAGDKRFWKDVRIIYESYKEPKYVTFDFEELYSEPWPVAAICLSNTWINAHSVSPRTGQVTKVTELDLSSIKAYTVTIRDILAKYQCTELYMDYIRTDFDDILFEAFPKETDLEVLSLQGPKLHYKVWCSASHETKFHRWLIPVLSQFCKNLKTLDLTNSSLSNPDYLAIAKSLPTSLEELFLLQAHSGYPHYDVLAKSSPNLKVLELPLSQAKCPSLLELKFLEVLHLTAYYFISNLYMYLVKFPALKAIYIYDYEYSETGGNFKELKAALELHGLIVEIKKNYESRYRYEHRAYTVLWRISKTE